MRSMQRRGAGPAAFEMLVGEPGIGKTRLAGELAREVHLDGATVLYGRSEEERLMPYQPFVEALGHYIASLPGVQRADDHCTRRPGGVHDGVEIVDPAFPRKRSASWEGIGGSGLLHVE